MRTTVRERLYARLVADQATGCLLWTGGLNNRGYGVIGVGGDKKLVHRVAWQLDNGPIPEGLTIDHVYDRGCRHKHCANVAHLEPVTLAENIRRYLIVQSFDPRPERPIKPRPAVGDDAPVPPPSKAAMEAVAIFDRLYPVPH